MPLAVVGFLTVGSGTGAAQDKAIEPQSPASAPTSAPTVVITAPRLQRDWLSFPGSIAIIDDHVIRQGQQMLQLDQALARVPGVIASNGTNFAQDLRVAIRGFGARSPFGIRGVQVIVDGIPATVTDGQSQVDAIDLGTIEHIQVLRGPFSALYGNATGGLIDLTTQTPSAGGDYVAEAGFGANGYARTSATVGRQYEPWGYIATVTDLQLDGFREHGSVHKKLLTAHANVQLGATAALGFTARLLDAPDTEDPGAVPLELAQSDPESARPENILFDSRQSAAEQTFGLVYSDRVGARQDVRVRLFHSSRDLIQYLPFHDGGVVAFDRAFYGGSLQTTGRGRLSGTDHRWTAGIDFSRQNDDRQRFDNEAGSKGSRVFDETQSATSVGLFVQGVWSLTGQLDLSVGLRHDWLEFEIDDHFVSATNADDSGRRRYTEFSGNLGASYAWRPDQRVYFNVATAFESPTFSEFANPSGQGGFNPAIEPQTAINHEIGAKGFFGHDGRYQISAFSIDVQDELIVYGSAGGRDFYENSGASRRRGIEASVEYYFTDHLVATASYTYGKYEFVEFVNRNGDDLSGNRLPGLPQQVLFGELAWRSPGVGFAALDVQWASELDANDANDVQVPGHVVVNARVGKVFHPGGRALTVHVGVDNLFDESYFSNIRINAFGGRYYEAAPGRTVHAGLKLEF